MADVIAESSLNEIDKIIQPLVGNKAWDCRIGVGSFLLVEFGKSFTRAIPAGFGRPEKSFERGEWGLWLYSCMWRIESGDEVIASSGSRSREIIEAAATKLNGLTVESVRIDNEQWDTAFGFSNNYTIRTFSDDDEAAQWKLKTPSGKYFNAGPGKEWKMRA